MECERCHKQTGIIKHIRIKKKEEKIFTFNNSDEAMICMSCYHNRPTFYGVYTVETIRNG